MDDEKEYYNQVQLRLSCISMAIEANKYLEHDTLTGILEDAKRIYTWIIEGKGTNG